MNEKNAEIIGRTSYNEIASEKWLELERGCSMNRLCFNFRSKNSKVRRSVAMPPSSTNKSKPNTNKNPDTEQLKSGKSSKPNNTKQKPKKNT